MKVLFSCAQFGHGPLLSEKCYHHHFTTRVAKRAKVMFSQAYVTHSGQRGVIGEVGDTKGHTPPPRDQVATSPSPQDQVTTPPHLNQVTTPPPPPGPDHNIPPRTRSQHLPPPWDQVTTPPPLEPGHNTSLPPQARTQHLPPPQGTMRRRVVRILLECILVLNVNFFLFVELLVVTCAQTVNWTDRLECHHSEHKIRQ